MHHARSIRTMIQAIQMPDFVDCFLDSPCGEAGSIAGQSIKFRPKAGQRNYGHAGEDRGQPKDKIEGWHIKVKVRYGQYLAGPLFPGQELDGHLGIVLVPARVINPVRDMDRFLCDHDPCVEDLGQATGYGGR